MTPSCELVQQWITEGHYQDYCSPTAYLIGKVAQWGYEQRGATNEAALQKARDEELEACLEEIRDGAGRVYIDESKLRVCLADDIWTARRPNAKSQAEEALNALDDAMIGGYIITTSSAALTIRAALERLRELEQSDG